MKSAVFVALIVAAAAVEYGALQDVLDQAPYHTLRLSEIEAKVAGSGPMDQIGALCYKQMREIVAEVDELDATHMKFTRDCSSTLGAYTSKINRLAIAVAKYDKKGAQLSVKWNKLRRKIPPQRRKRIKWLKSIKKKEKYIVKKLDRRAREKALYDQDMRDFAAALKDIDHLKKILENSALAGKATKHSPGFLEAVGQIKSEKLLASTHRLTLAASFLDEEQEAEGPSGVDKVINLLLKVRNEMWKEMDKLTKIENHRINAWKRKYLRTRKKINHMHVQRARAYIKIGNVLRKIGKLMIREANERIKSARTTKKIDATDIQRDFLQDSCDAEPPMYTKTRSTKMAEIATIKLMLKILKNLNWSGAVYSAISRIGGGATDTNPEAGYEVGWTMNVHTGLKKNIFWTNKAIAKSGFGRVAIKLTIGSSWVWASFDAYSANKNDYHMPTKANGRVQNRYVNNLHIFKSASAPVEAAANVKRGFLEMWPTNYGKANVKRVPGASDGLYDFGDQRSARHSYGCFQVHDYMNKQTVLAVNNFLAVDGKHDVGIGNQKRTHSQQPDWTFSQTARKYRDAKQNVQVQVFFQTKAPKTKKD
jgi:hypothetical protein